MFIKNRAAMITAVVIFATFFAGLCTGIIFCAVRFSLEAEKTYQGTLFTYELVNRYIEENGAWPGSWQDLEQISMPGRGGFIWPKDSARVQAYVHVRFDVEISEVKDSLREWNAAWDIIGPRKPCFSLENCSEVEKLSETVEQF